MASSSFAEPNPRQPLRPVPLQERVEPENELPRRLVQNATGLYIFPARLRVSNLCKPGPACVAGGYQWRFFKGLC